MSEPTDKDSLRIEAHVIRATAWFGVALSLTYALGFVVANAFYGTLWAIEPSLLQARYLAAGVLYFAFVVTSIVPTYYLISAINAWKDRGEESEESRELGEYLLAVVKRLSAGRKPLALGVGIVVLAGIAFLFVFVAIVLLGPFLSLLLFTTIGASPREVLFPVLGFHATLFATVILHRLSGLTAAEQWNLKREPHRAVLAVLAVLMHASAFGVVLYPRVPASAGGGRPLPVEITFSDSLTAAAALGHSVSSAVVSGAFLVSSDPSAHLFLISDSSVAVDGEPRLCATSVRADLVMAIRVHEGRTWEGSLRNVESGEPSIATRIRDCR